jgi:hypothetical protein
MRWKGLFRLMMLSAMLFMISCAKCKNGATNDCFEGGLDEVELLEKTRYVLQSISCFVKVLKRTAEPIVTTT